MRTIRVTFDTVPACYPAYAINPGEISLLPVELDMVKLAALLGETITVADVIDNSSGTLMTKPLPFHVADITVGLGYASSRWLYLINTRWDISTAGKLRMYMDFLNVDFINNRQHQATKEQIAVSAFDIHILHSSTVPQQHLVTANYSTLT